MSLPDNAPVFTDRTDPTNVLDWYLVISRGNGPDDLLRADEDIDSYQLAPSAEAVAAGLQVLTGARAPIREGLHLSFWSTIAPASRGSPIFDSPGVELGIELTIDTTFGRTKQMTVGQLVKQK